MYNIMSIITNLCFFDQINLKKINIFFLTKNFFFNILGTLYINKYLHSIPIKPVIIKYILLLTNSMSVNNDNK